MSNVFIRLISSISNPVLSTIFTVILFLSMFWKVNLTTIIMKHIVSSESMSRKRRNPQALPNAYQQFIFLRNVIILLLNVVYIFMYCILNNYIPP